MATGGRFDDAVHEARALGRELVWLLNRHTPGTRPAIALHATRRGGSTMLQEAIGANPGVRSVKQPFGNETANLTAGKFRHQPKWRYGELVWLDETDEAEVTAFVEGLLDGSIGINAPTRPWRPDFHLRTDRILLKIVSAKGLIDWLDRTFDVQTVYLTRHPIPQALSCIRNGWPPHTAAYLRERLFTEAMLDPDQLGRCREIEAGHDVLARHVLGWALENLIPLRLSPDRPGWLVLSYEDVVIRPDEVVHELADRLDLPEVEAMRRTLRAPSLSSGLSEQATRAEIRRGSGDALVAGWRRAVDQRAEARAMAVLEMLGIDRYAAGEVTART